MPGVMFEYLQVRNAVIVLIVRPRRYGRTAVSKIDGPLQGLKAVGLDRARGVPTDGDSSQRIRQPRPCCLRHFGPHLHRSPHADTAVRIPLALLRKSGWH